MAVAAPVASAAPWPCDNAGYLTQFDGANPAAGTVFNRADRQPDGNYLLNPLGTLPAEHINALAFRPQDGLMYTFNNTTQEVTRIERDPITGAPTFQDIGNPAGSGITLTVIGAVLADGTYFVWQSTGIGTGFGAIYDVSGPTAQLVTTVTLDPASPDGFRGDFAISPVDGQIYGVNPHNPADPNSGWGVYRFTLNGNVLSRGPLVADVGGNAFGGAWFQPDGTFIVYANGAIDTPPEGNGVYGINLTTGQRTFLGAGPAFSNADGTACANGIALTKDASPRTVTAGTELTYTHTMTSRALVDSPVTFSDQLPAGMTYVPGGVTVSPQIGTLNNYGGTDTLSFSGTISPQQTVTVTARVRVAPDHPCGVDVQNQSQATLSIPGSPPFTADSDDPTTPAAPEDPTAVRVNCEADVEVIKGSSAPLVAGEEGTYTLRAINHGPSRATNKVISDDLPDAVSFVSASDGCSETGGTVSCTVASLDVGASQTFTVRVRVDSSADSCEDVRNTATVTGGTPDPEPINNESTICNFERRADLSIGKAESSATVAPGGQVMYTLVVRNRGPSDEPRAVVKDPVPAGLTLVSAEAAQGSCSTAGNALECDLGSLRSGGSTQILVTATLTATGCVTNTARVSGDAFDPKLDNNVDDARVCPEAGPDPKFDLVVNKTVNKKKPRVGQTVRYRVRVTNRGPDAAPSATIKDTLNAPVRVVSVKASQGSCTKRIPMTCELGTIPAGGRVTITIRAKHREPVSGNCSRRGQRNAASATADGTDTNPANNLDVVKVCPKVELRLTKKVSTGTVRAGQTFSYSIRVHNPSRVAVRKVRTCDRLPAGLVYVSSKPKAKLSKGQHCWTAKRIGGRKSKTYKVTVRALAGASGRLVNTATASSPSTKRVRGKRGVQVIGQQIDPPQPTG